MTATGTVFAGPGRVKGLFIYSKQEGTLILKDGGSGGTSKIDITAHLGGVYVDIGANGVRFSTDIHITLTNIDAVTVFWG
jgi:hypothetical protein